MSSDAEIVRQQGAALEVFRRELEDENQHIEDAVCAAVVFALGEAREHVTRQEVAIGKTLRVHDENERLRKAWQTQQSLLARVDNALTQRNIECEQARRELEDLRQTHGAALTALARIARGSLTQGPTAAQIAREYLDA